MVQTRQSIKSKSSFDQFDENVGSGDVLLFLVPSRVDKRAVGEREDGIWSIRETGFSELF